MKKENRDLTAWMPKIVANAEAKGFGVKKLTADYVAKKANLIISEIGEAIEAEREGRKADLNKFQKKQQSYLQSTGQPYTKEEAFKEAFEETIKDTVEDEIADAVIRTLNLFYQLGARQITASVYSIGLPSNQQTIILEGTSKIAYLLSTYMQDNGVKAILRAKTQEEVEADLAKCLRPLFSLKLFRGFDLLKHIELKMKYNEMRPKMHGNKKY